MAIPATKEQVDRWVKTGKVTALQGKQLLSVDPDDPADIDEAHAAPAERRPKSVSTTWMPGIPKRLDWGPSPRWRDLAAPAWGIVAALTVGILLIVTDLVREVKYKADPGEILLWAPTTAAGLALLLAMLSY